MIKNTTVPLLFFRRLALLLSVAYLLCAGYPLLAAEKPIPTAQSEKGTGIIIGTIVDEQEKPASGILVTALGYDGVEKDELKLKLFFREGQLPEVRTDDRGRFRIANLPPGMWVLRTSSGPFDKGDYIRPQSAVTNQVLIIDLKSGSTFNVGSVRLRK
jgi:hypothetical protein